MSLLGDIAKVALPAVGSLIPGVGPIAGSILGAVGQGVSNHLTNKSTAKATEADFRQQKQLQDEFNIFSASQAQKQMDFQEEMSSTAHQREVKDLEAAGLNPILSAKLGGASSPSGAQAGNLQSPAQTKASATAARQVLLQEKSLQADIDLKRAQAAATRADAGLKTATTNQTNYKLEERIDSAIAKTMSEIGHISSQENINRLESMIITEIKFPSGQIDIEKAKLMVQELNMKIDALKKNPSLITQELAQKGGTASGIVNLTINAVEKARDKVLELLPYPYGTK